MFKNKKNWKSAVKASVGLLCLVAAYAIAVPQAAALEYGYIGIKPSNPDPAVENSESWFIYNLEPGSVIEDSVTVLNTDDEPSDVLIYAADSTPSSSGGFALRQFTEPKEGVGSWVRLYPDDPPQFLRNYFQTKDESILALCEVTREELAANARLTITDEQYAELSTWCAGVEYIERTMPPVTNYAIPFVFRVPTDLDVGEHTGGLCVQKVLPEPADGGAGSSARITTRVGARIYQTVPGEIIRQLAFFSPEDDLKVIKNFDEFNYKRWFDNTIKPEEYLLQTKIKSSSNVSVDFVERIHIKDVLFGKKTEDYERSFQILRGDTFTSNLSWNNPRFGRFTFSKEIVYTDSAGMEQILTTRTVSIWIMPWREIVLSVVFIVLFVLAMLIRRWLYRKFNPVVWEEYTVAQGEDIMKIAAKYTANWKKVAKYNKLRAPYTLEVGKTVLVPICKGGSWTSYTVKKDDTITSIATALGADWKKLARKNKLKAPYTLEVGQVISVPEKKDGKAAAAGLFGLSKRLTIILAVAAAILAVVILVIAVKQVLPKKQALKADVSLTDVGAQTPVDPSAEQPAEGTDAGTPADGTVTPEPDETPAAGETNSPALPAKDQVSMLVLNGGAVAGSAGKVRDSLIADGYIKATAANAAASHDYSIVIFYGAEYAETATQIQTLLEVPYDNVTISEAVTDEQKQANIVIILGSSL